MMCDVFHCYRSGILSGIATFTSTQVLYQERSFTSGAISEPQPMTNNQLFHPCLYDLWRKASMQHWDGDDVDLGELAYKLHLQVSDPEIGEGRVYAQIQSSSPMDIVTSGGKLVGFMLPHRNESVTLVKNGYQTITNQRLWNDPLVSSDSYNVEEVGTFMVPMRDGIRLSTVVTLPKSEWGGQWPAILVRTCYNKNDKKQLWDKYAKRGYAVVVQDVRGREASEGEWVPFANEKDDGDDTLSWISAQPWSNGRVGMIGGSYLGFVQWAAAASGNPHLKAIVSQVTAGSPFVDLPRRGGAFGSGILAWSFMVAKQATDVGACVRTDWDKLLAHRPISEIPKIALGENIPFYDRWMEHPDDDAFWKRSDWSLHGYQIDVPALCVSGWFDDDGPGTTQAWAMNRKNERRHQRLLIGPWLHKANSSRKIHNYELPANALRYDLDCLYLRWFDRFLKNIDNGVDTEQQVEYYMLGDNTWRSSQQWPPENVQPKRLYLMSQTNAQSVFGDGRLVSDVPEGVGCSEYLCDPQQPFPYIIDVSENECAVPEDYQEAEKRSDVLVYTTEALTRAIAIAGDPQVTLYAASSCPDTDWILRLTDVSPEGNSIKLADGILRARYRKSFESSKLLTPGCVETYSIQLTRIAHTFKAGHRIRLQVTSGADNLCFANSQTGGDESQAKSLVQALNTVYHGGDMASYIELPLLE